MIIYIVGHRGVGKTTALKALRSAEAMASWKFFDLDQVIEQEMQTSIDSLFQTRGELFFRKTEIEVFRRLMENIQKPAVIALGAGFDLSVVQREVDDLIVCLRRDTDKDGRIFFDRPRLNLNVDPIEESIERYNLREPLFKNYADVFWQLPEGRIGLPTEFVDLMRGNLELDNGFLTLYRLKASLKVLKRINPQNIELRSDLLTNDEMQEAIEQLSPKQIMVSRRTLDFYVDSFDSQKVVFWDWPLEHGEPPATEPQWNVLSIHARLGNETLLQTLDRLNSFSGDRYYLKLAIPIETFEELRTCHQWYLQDPERRVFLPQSSVGKWRWYRNFLSRGMKFSFLRFFADDVKDQPSVGEWLRLRGLSKKEFSAVIGSPVYHSWTPSENAPFFRKEFSWAVLPIDVNLQDLQQGAVLDLLSIYGLRAASVTAPLKQGVVSLLKEKSPEIAELDAINTLYVDDQLQILGTNTDLKAFEEVVRIHELNSGSVRVVVFGGGGTLNVMKAALASASFYSVRTLSPRTGSAAIEDPSVLIWAAGSLDINIFNKMPFIGWRPGKIIDLSYTENSPARHYALLSGAEYVSGGQMFQLQAAEQRVFWRYQRGQI